MRFKKQAEWEQYPKPVEIIPLINLLFLLLLFLLLVSNFVLQPGMKINLPKVFTSDALPLENIELVITGENLVYFDDKPISQDNLKNLVMQAAKRKQPVLIKADKAASLASSVMIWDLCRNSGVAQVNIATN